jgi:hypothetical protein
MNYIGYRQYAIVYLEIQSFLATVVCVIMTSILLCIIIIIIIIITTTTYLFIRLS